MLPEKIKARISRRLKDSEVSRIVTEEVKQFMAERPPSIGAQEYYTTVALFILRELFSQTLVKSGDVAAAETAHADELDFDTILNGLLIWMQKDLLGSNIQMLKALGSAIAERDTGSRAHPLKVTLYAVQLAEQADLNKDQIRTIIKGSFIHDIGKIGIPDSTLLKAGKLSDDERKIMNSHPTLGAHIIEGVMWLEDARDIVLHHHERFDGSGYPSGLQGYGIPISARVFTIVDVFDALTSDRPYKKALSYDDTIAYMHNQSGRHFDPTLLMKFFEIAISLYNEIRQSTIDELEELLVEVISGYSGLDPHGIYLRSLYTL